MMQQLEHSREKLNRSRNERESNAAQRELEELRKLVRDREDEIGRSSRPTPTASRQQIEATEAESEEGLGASSARPRAASQSKLGEVEARTERERPARDEAVEEAPAQLYRRYEHDSAEARHRHRADDRRHVQGVQHGAAAAAVSPAAPRAGARAVPVVQPHHLLRSARAAGEPTQSKA